MNSSRYWWSVEELQKELITAKSKNDKSMVMMIESQISTLLKAPKSTALGVEIHRLKSRYDMACDNAHKDPNFSDWSEINGLMAKICKLNRELEIFEIEEGVTS